MISLLKIRIKQAKGNLGNFVIYHIIIPVLIIVAGIILKIKGPKKNLNINAKTPSYIKGEYYLFPKEEDKYKNIVYYLEELSIISNDENECKSFADFIKNETFNASDTIFALEKQEFKCYKSEEDLPIDQDAISIIKKNEQYEFQFIKHNSYSFFKFEILSISNIIDLFNVENFCVSNETKYDVEYSIYLELQSLIAKYLIEKKTKEKISYDSKNMKITVGLNHYPEYTNLNQPENTKVLSIGVYSLILSLLFSLYTYTMIITMIEEKEKKLYLFLKRYGVSSIKYAISWFCSFILINIPYIIGFFLLFSSLLYFHSYLFLIDIILFVLALFPFSYFLYSCIPSTRAGYILLKLFNFGSCLLGLAISFQLVPKTIKVIFGFIPQINIFYCTYSIFELQLFKDLTFERLRLETNKISYFESILIYLFSLIFFSLLSLLLHLFPFNCFSSFKKASLNEQDDLIDNLKEYHEDLSSKKKDNQYLSINDISKTFGGLNTINNLNVECISDEIFCLVGENGAGKSTLLNIISGNIEPDKNNGNIVHNGMSIKSKKKYLYQNIALCEQDNLLFEYLTVFEHLKYMQDLKLGYTDYNALNELLKDFDLLEKEDYPCWTLSEGQKRKLCIALALVANSQIILLDEPTSEMDIISKKKFWAILNKYKQNKIIIITTHSLGEAECIADRIGIMKGGRLLCSGSSSYLKKEYSCGYTINILLDVKTEKYTENNENIVKNVINIENNAKIKNIDKGIISVNIHSNSQNISKIFQYLEESKELLGIEDYILKSTSLEDVFFKINSKENSNSNDKENNNNIDNENIPVLNRNNEANTKGFCSQLLSQLKRLSFSLKRYFILHIFELIIGLFGALVLFLLFFRYWMMDIANIKKDLNLFEVLGSNKNYIYDEKDFLKNSYAYTLSKNKIPLEKIQNKPNNITEFIDSVYDKAFANIAKGSIYINKEENNTVYEVYNSEIFTNSYGNVYANTMLFVSAFLKKEYNIDASILTQINYKLYKKRPYILFEILRDILSLLMICITIVYGLLFFLIGLVNQKLIEENNLKKLIYLNGGNLWSYWISLIINNSIKIIIFTSFLIIPICSINKNIGGYFWLNIFLGSMSSLIFIYFLSYFCSREDSLIKIIFLYIIICIGIGFILRNFKIEKDLIKLLVREYHPTSFDLNPIGSMIFSCLRLSYHYSFLPAMKSDIGMNKVKKVFFNGLIMQLINFIFYTILLIIEECGIFRKISNIIKTKIILKEKKYIKKGGYKESLEIDSNIGPLLSKSRISMSLIRDDDEDELVINEVIDEKKTDSNIINDPLINQYVINEINRIGDEGFLTKIEDVQKTFWYCCKKNVKAVNHLYLGLELNEKMGLLGFNGSGKTVTFKVIINELLYDSGAITLFGYDNRKQFNKINSEIGYCPQENIPFNYMTVKEIIQFFSGLKINNDTVEHICNKFDLSNYINTFYYNLSGGNKKKLLLALSLMNNPNLLLLDQPLGKLDPISKENMITNIKSITKDNQRYNMILSTNSLEEAHLLCDRISWFKKGNFTVLAKPKELISSYKKIYKLYIKYNQSEILKTKEQNKNSNEKIFNYLSTTIKNYKLYEDLANQNPILNNHSEYLYYIINDINDNVNNIELNGINIDNSYDFYFEIKEGKKEALFNKIIDLKNKYQQISEIYIGKYSLENILI